MRGGTHFCIRTLNISEKYAYGKFIKFDDALDISDSLTGEQQYKAKSTDSSKRYEFMFVFDYERHILAVQDKRGLPTKNTLVKCIRGVFEFVTCSMNGYSLKINELSLASSIDEVLCEGNTFNTATISLTFSNSQQFASAMSKRMKELEKELKEKHVVERVILEKSDENSPMSSLTDEATAMLGLAPKYGNAKVSFNTPDGVKKRYQMTDHPVRLLVADFFNDAISGSPGKMVRKKKSLIDFALDVWNTISSADQLAQDSKEVLKKLRGKNEKK